VILFGGYDGDYDDETWIYNLTDNSWNNMNPISKPLLREQHSMVYDSVHDRTIMFGGLMGSRFDDTWFYNLTDNSWTNKNPSTKPSSRCDHSMVYDSLHDRVILFGGDNDDVKTWIFSDFRNYYQQGIFNSKLNSLNSVYNITGEINWTPIEQPIGTSLTVQIGFSNSSVEANFIYTALQNSSFTFEGIGKYFKYRVIFKSDLLQNVSPLLNQTFISYNLENITGDTTPQIDNGITIGFNNIAIISFVLVLNITGIVLYSKKKIRNSII